MSSPHSRRQTNGAFGNQKPRPIGRVFDSPAPVREEKGPKQKTIADRLAEFSQPLLENANNEFTKKGAFNLGVMIWNAIIEGPEKIKEIKKFFASLPDSNAEKAEEYIDMMIERKNQLFPEDNSLITSFEYNYKYRSSSIRLKSTNVKPEGLKTGDFVNKIKNVSAESPSRLANPD